MYQAVCAIRSVSTIQYLINIAMKHLLVVHEDCKLIQLSRPPLTTKKVKRFEAKVWKERGKII